MSVCLVPGFVTQLPKTSVCRVPCFRDNFSPETSLYRVPGIRDTISVIRLFDVCEAFVSQLV